MEIEKEKKLVIVLNRVNLAKKRMPRELRSLLSGATAPR